jgi:RNase P/RNase MRP subunit p29
MPQEYLIGKRVEIAPHYDAWMMGDRFGEVVKVTPSYVFVKMDRSGKTRKVSAVDGLQRVIY